MISCNRSVSYHTWAVSSATGIVVMSLDHIVWVLKHSHSEHGSRLTLLVLAEYANPEDGVACPSLDRLAARARLSRRAVHGCLRKLIELGEVEELPGPHPIYGTRSFRLLMGGAETAPGDAVSDQGGVQSATSNVSQTAPEPTTKPKAKTNGREEKLFEAPDVVERIWNHYVAVVPGATRFKLDQRNRTVIRNALKDSDEATIIRAITGISRDGWWLRRFPDRIELRHALVGSAAKGESNQARIEKFASEVGESGSDGRVTVEQLLAPYTGYPREKVAGLMGDVRRVLFEPSDQNQRIADQAETWLRENAGIVVVERSGRQIVWGKA